MSPAPDKHLDGEIDYEEPEVISLVDIMNEGVE